MAPKKEQHYTILIADDTQFNRDFLRAILEDTYEIIEAVDGIQAVTILQQKDQEISLLLLDLNMPNMDGFGVLDAMNKYGWIDSVPVIMITAEEGPGLLKRAYDLGVTDYLKRDTDVETVRRRASNTIIDRKSVV